MRRIFIFLRSAVFSAACSVFFAVQVPAAYSHTLISVGDRVLADIRFLSRESGKSLTSFTPPLSSHEVERLIEAIDYETLSGAGRIAYRRVENALRPRPQLSDGLFGISAHPELSFEARARTNGDLDWTAPASRVPSAAKLPLEFFFGDSVYAAGDLQLSLDPSYYNRGDDRAATNLPISSAELDMNMPLRSFISAGGAFWNFQLGRNRLSFGTGFTGNLAIGDTPDYYDYSRLSLFSPNFKYSLLVAQLPMAAGGLGGTYADRYPNASLTETTQRYLYYHRWDLRLYERLSISIGEGCLVGNSPLELRFLNPLAMYHGYFAWKDYPAADGELVGSLLSLEIDWAISRGWSAYAQAVMNDFQTPYEKKRWPDAAHPNGLGYLAGIERTASFGPWRAVFAVEAVYADPFLYVLSSPFSSYVWMRKLSALSGKEPRYSWIGHGDGRDFILFDARARLERDAGVGALLLEGGVSYKIQGEHGLEWDWDKGAEAASETTPTGTPEKRFKLRASGEWRPSPRYAFGIGAAALFLSDADHVEGKNELGAEFSFSASISW